MGLDGLTTAPDAAAIGFGGSIPGDTALSSTLFLILFLAGTGGEGGPTCPCGGSWIEL